MAEIKFSKQLSDKLGDRKGEIEELKGLVDFKPILFEMMEANKCSDAVRDNVIEKMEHLTEVLVKITSINAMHIGNDAKVKKIEKELEGFELKAFKTELYAEISSTNKTLQGKAKEMASSIKESVSEKYTSLKNMFTDNMKIVTEQLEAAKKKEAELKRKKEVNKDLTLEELEAKKSDLIEARKALKAENRDLEEEYEATEDNKQLMVSNYKSLGFFGTFRRMWSQRKENPDKKQGFFKTVKDAYREAALNKSEPSAKEMKSEIEDLYAQQIETAMQIKKNELDRKKLAHQLKELNKEISLAAQTSMEICKSSLDEAVSPVKPEEITPSKLKLLVEKVTKMGKDSDKSKGWKDKIVNAINKVFEYTIDPITDLVFGSDEEEKSSNKTSEKTSKRNSGMDR